MSALKAALSRKVPVSFLIAILIGSSMGLVVLGVQLNSKALNIPTNLQLNQYQNVQGYSQIIFTDGIYYSAKNGTTGVIDFGGAGNAGGASGTNATDLIIKVWNNVYAAGGGSILLSTGVYGLSTWIYPTPIATPIYAPISLIGEAGAVLEAQAGFSQSRILYLQGYDGVTISGITFTSAAGSGLNVMGVVFNPVLDGTIEDSYFYNLSYSVNDWAILIEGNSRNCLVTRNTIEGQYTGGVGVQSGIPMKVMENTIKTDYFGIDFEFSSLGGDYMGDVIVSQNTILNCTNSGQPWGIEVWNYGGANGTKANVENNILTNAGIIITNSLNVLVEGNSIFNAQDPADSGRVGGIALEGSQYVLVGGNQVTLSIFGVNETDYNSTRLSDYNTIENNGFYNCSTGVAKVGANTVVQFNRGFVTEATGSLAIPSTYNTTWDATLSGGYSWTTNGISFDGVNGVLATNTNFANMPMNDVAIMIWFKTNASVPANNYPVWSASYGAYSASSGGHWTFTYYNGSTTFTISSNATILGNTVYLLTMLKNSTG